MFKDRTYLIIALAAVLILALGVSAWFYWGRSVPGIDRGVACKWDPNQLDGKPDTCEGQCAPTYFGGITNQGVINGKIMHFCCSKGYTVVAVEDPRTHLPVDVVCRKDGP
jgi:hypothetical protein